MVGSPSGKVADCNSALASSTLAPTSNKLKRKRYEEIIYEHFKLVATHFPKHIVARD